MAGGKGVLFIITVVVFLACALAVSVEELEAALLLQAKELKRKDGELKRLRDQLKSQGDAPGGGGGSCSAQPSGGGAQQPAFKAGGRFPMVFRPNVTRVISHSDPRVLLMPDFLSHEECDYIKAKGTPLLKDSVVVGAEDGAGLRKSKSAFFPRSWEETDPTLALILEKIHNFVMIPSEYGEDLQIASYQPGDKYELHMDSDAQVGRVATFLVYLEETEEGGETLFPGVKPRKVKKEKFRGKRKEELKPVLFGQKNQPPMKEYCESDDFFKVRPKKGTAVLFFNHQPDLRTDPRSIHGACPVIKGTKTIAQRWIRFWKWSEGNVFYDTFIRGKK